jgi:hypothetical protein
MNEELHADPSLLFIDVDPRKPAIKQYVGRARSTISRHVQLDIVRKRREEAAQKLENWRPTYKYKRNSRGGPGERAPNNGKRRCGETDILQDDNPMQKKAPDFRRRNAETGSGDQSNTPLHANSLVLTRLTGGSSDPFSSTPIPIDPWTNGLLRHQIDEVIPCIFSAESKRSKPSRQFEVLAREMSSCIGDEAGMLSMRAISSSHLEAFGGGGRLQWTAFSPPGSGCMKLSLYFRTRCMRTIRLKLMGWPKAFNEETIGYVGRLAVSELFAGNYDTVRMHFQAVLRMAGSVAHLQSLIAPERIERFFMIDTKAAVLSLSVPAFPLEWEPPPLDNPTLTKIAPSASTLLSSLGKGLLSPQLSPVLGTELQAITSDLVQVVHLSEWTHLHPEDVTPPDLKWINLKTIALEHKLLGISSTATSDFQSLQSICINALFLFTNITLNTAFPRSMFLRALLSRHKNELALFLSTQDLRSDFEYPDLLLWVLCAGADAASLLPEPDSTSEQAWFVTYLALMARRLRLNEFEDAKDVLGGFFYWDQVHGEAFRDLWTWIENELDK